MIVSQEKYRLNEDKDALIPSKIEKDFFIPFQKPALSLLQSNKNEAFFPFSFMAPKDKE